MLQLYQVCCCAADGRHARRCHTTSEKRQRQKQKGERGRWQLGSCESSLVPRHPVGFRPLVLYKPPFQRNQTEKTYLVFGAEVARVYIFHCCSRRYRAWTISLLATTRNIAGTYLLVAVGNGSRELHLLAKICNVDIYLIFARKFKSLQIGAACRAQLGRAALPQRSSLAANLPGVFDTLLCSAFSFTRPCNVYDPC